MSTRRQYLVIALLASLVVAVPASATDYTTADPGYITGTMLQLEGTWYARPGLDTFPPAVLPAPYPVQSHLAPTEEIDQVTLYYGQPGSDPFASVLMTIDGETVMGEIPEVDPADFNYCLGQWDYSFYLIGAAGDGSYSEADERHYADGSGGDPYIFQILNPQPNQTPQSDPGGPYHVNRWENLTVDGSASLDPEGGPLTYQWDVWADWEDYDPMPYVWDDEFDDGSGPNPTFNFDENGEYNIRLLVEDECGEGHVAQTTIQVYDPHVVVIPQDDSIAAINWQEGLQLTLSVNGDEISTKPALYLNPGDGFGAGWDGDELGDVVPGMEVTVSANDGTIRSHTVRDIGIDFIDYDNDVVGGWAQPGTLVKVRAEDPYWHEIEAWAQDEGDLEPGNWIADFGAASIDLTPEVRVNALQQNDGDSSHTLVFPGGPPEPRHPAFTIQPDHRWASGWEWPLGVDITLIIDEDTNPENGVIHQATLTSWEAEWDPEIGVVQFEFGEVEGVARGQYVTMSDGVTTKDTWIADVYFDNLDPVADIASGRGPAGAQIGVWINVGENEYFAELEIPASGEWVADFSSQNPDFSGVDDARVVVWDEDGDETMVHLPPPPILHAVPAHPEVHGHEWNSEAYVTLTIEDPSTGATYSASKYVYEDPWCGDPCFDLQGEWDLQPGHIVTMADDMGHLVVVHVTALVITEVDLAADTVSGTASPGSEVWVAIHEEGGVFRHVLADASGHWIADFSVVGDEEWEENTFDLVPGTGGRAIQFENLEPDDGTLAYWPGPSRFESGGFSENPVLYGSEVTIEAVYRAMAFDTGYCQIEEMEFLVFTGEGPTVLPATLVCDGQFAAGSALFTPLEPGVYPVVVRAIDAVGAEAGEFLGYLAVYDPEGGFVTGGGWIWSPLGAYAADPALEGKASFGFVSKYKRGADVPSGQTEFQFRLADLNFKSTSYDWLVVAGKKAMFKGLGTINGEGEYRFMLSAIDGDLQGGDGLDRFRIRIWYEEDGAEIVVYDNQMDDYPDADPSTELGGGEIVIHKAP